MGPAAEFFRRLCGLVIDPTFMPNFFWTPFNLRAFLEAHRPFSDQFVEKHGHRFEAILTAIAALYLWMLYMWMQSHGNYCLKHWQHAYEGPLSRDKITDSCAAFLPQALMLLNLQPNYVNEEGLRQALTWLELSEAAQADIELGFAGPHSVLLPFGPDLLFIDFAWIERRLALLFHGVELPDQNFKGTALEVLVRGGGSVLPFGQCYATDGTSKQVDAAFRCNEILVIVECRAKGRSIGWERGDPSAVRMRLEFVEKALLDIDEKARWFVRHPVGTNYDVTWCKAIIPLAVTPFIEFMPSLEPRYWLRDGLPRVLTPQELKNILADGTLNTSLWNSVISNSE